MLWLVADQDSLSVAAKTAISKSAGNIFVSSISALEIGIKVRRKKLRLPIPVSEWYEKALSLHGLADLPVSWRIAAQASSLPLLHDDPFDRIIIAAGLLSQAKIVTPDRHFKKYPGLEMIW